MYNRNIDYRKYIDAAAAREDFGAASHYEDLRNSKIDGEGLDEPKTYNYGIMDPVESYDEFDDENANAITQRNSDIDKHINNLSAAVKANPYRENEDLYQRMFELGFEKEINDEWLEKQKSLKEKNAKNDKLGMDIEDSSIYNKSDSMFDIDRPVSYPRGADARKSIEEAIKADWFNGENGAGEMEKLPNYPGDGDGADTYPGSLKPVPMPSYPGIGKPVPMPSYPGNWNPVPFPRYPGAQDDPLVINDAQWPESEDELLGLGHGMKGEVSGLGEENSDNSQYFSNTNSLDSQPPFLSQGMKMPLVGEKTQNPIFNGGMKIDNALNTSPLNENRVQNYSFTGSYIGGNRIYKEDDTGNLYFDYNGIRYYVTLSYDENGYEQYNIIPGSEVKIDDSDEAKSGESSTDSPSGSGTYQVNPGTETVKVTGTPISGGLTQNTASNLINIAKTYEKSTFSDMKTAKMVGGSEEGGWCTSFLLHAAKEAKLDNSLPLLNSSTATTHTNYSKAGRYATAEDVYKGKYEPQPGDFVIFYSDGEDNHIGMVISYDKDTGEVETIEGNTYKPGTQTIKGVYQKTRKIKNDDGTLCSSGSFYIMGFCKNSVY